MRTRLGVIMLAIGIPLLFFPFWGPSTPLSVHAPLALVDPWMTPELMEERVELFAPFPEDFYIEVRGDRLAPARAMMMAVVGEIPDAYPLATQRGGLWFKSNIFRTTLTREQYSEFARRPEVLGIWKVPAIELTKDYPWEPIERVAVTVGLDELHEAGYGGNGVIIAFTDEFPETLADFVVRGFPSRWADRVIEYHGKGDAFAHGLMTSSIAGYLAPQAKLGLISFEIDIFGALSEIERWVDKYPEYQIVSSNSWVFLYREDAYHNRLNPFNRKVVELSERGVVFLWGAGNWGKPGDHPEGICGYDTRAGGFPIEIGYPAALERVLSVAGVDALGEKALHFSSVGPAVDGMPDPDIAAPSMFISPWSPYDGRATGTSASTPVAAAAVACALTNLRVRDPVGFVRSVQQSASDRGAPGWDIEFGFGVIDASKLQTVVPSPTAPAPVPPMSLLGGGMTAVGALMLLPVWRFAS
ncbi:hypothetical protein ES706_02358 [subsurface metagenome]